MIDVPDPDMMTRETALALIDEAERWQAAYNRERELVASTVQQLADAGEALVALETALREARPYVYGIALRKDWDNWAEAERVLAVVDAALSVSPAPSEPAERCSYKAEPEQWVAALHANDDGLVQCLREAGHEGPHMMP